MSFRTPRRLGGFALIACLASAFALASPSALHAQVVNDPRIAEFDPSPDHWAVLDSGQPAVIRYELGMYLLGASAPFMTVDMGKPSPAQDGKIRYDFTAAVAGLLMPSGEYEARVSAVGPEGSALSDASNPFTFSASSTCAVALSTASVQAPAAGGQYAVNVSTSAGCRWTATTAQTWVTLSVTGGSGSGNVAFQVRANASTYSRTAIVAIGGQAVTVWQAAAASAATTPTLSWPTPLPISQGTPLSSIQLNATASAPGTFTYNPPAGTLLPTGTHTLTATFVPVDTALYRTAATYTTLVVDSAMYRLTVVRPSGGTISGAGINCGTVSNVCQVTMPASMTLGMQAAADSGYVFSGWTGDCSGTNPGIWLALNGVRSCGATFSALAPAPPAGTTAGTTGSTAGTQTWPTGAPYTLTIVRPSGGTVNGAGVNCGTVSSACQVTMPASMTIGMQATADAGYVFSGWSGHCAGTNPSYWLALNGARTCSAAFSPVAASTAGTSGASTGSGTASTGPPYTLTIARPSGGTVNGAGINCGAGGSLCQVSMPATMTLGIQATASAGYVFSGWTGDCSGTNPSYWLALNGVRSCGAVFSPIPGESH